MRYKVYKKNFFLIFFEKIDLIIPLKLFVCLFVHLLTRQFDLMGSNFHCLIGVTLGLL